jgi:hypothetical protein
MTPRSIAGLSAARWIALRQARLSRRAPVSRMRARIRRPLVGRDFKTPGPETLRTTKSTPGLRPSLAAEGIDEASRAQVEAVGPVQVDVRRGENTASFARLFS